jgi:hypothetical protein
VSQSAGAALPGFVVADRPGPMIAAKFSSISTGRTRVPKRDPGTWIRNSTRAADQQTTIWRTEMHRPDPRREAAASGPAAGHGPRNHCWRWLPYTGVSRVVLAQPCRLAPSRLLLKLARSKVVGLQKRGPERGDEPNFANPPHHARTYTDPTDDGISTGLPEPTPAQSPMDPTRPRRPATRAGFEIAVICALPIQRSEQVNVIKSKSSQFKSSQFNLGHIQVKLANSAT